MTASSRRSPTWWRVLDDRAHQSADPLNPQLVFHEFDQRAPQNMITTSDSGSATNWWARHVHAREGQRFSLSGTLATMLPGVPYAIAAKFAYPDRPVVAFAGDGAFSMLGMNELLTVKRYLKDLTAPEPDPDLRGAREQGPQPGLLRAARDGRRPHQ